MPENHYSKLAKLNIFVIGINWVISAVRVAQNKRFHNYISPSVCLLVQSYFNVQEIPMQRKCLEKKVEGKRADS